MGPKSLEVPGIGVVVSLVPIKYNEILNHAGVFAVVSG